MIVEGNLIEVKNELEAIEINQTALNQEVVIAEERMKEASQQRLLAIDAHNSATWSVATTDKEIDATKEKMDRARGQIFQMEGELDAIAQRLKDMQLDEQNRSTEEDQIEKRLESLFDEKKGAEKLLELHATVVSREESNYDEQRNAPEQHRCCRRSSKRLECQKS